MGLQVPFLKASREALRQSTARALSVAMADQFLARATKKTPHPARFHLRDGRALEGRVYLTERDCWAPYLSSRKRCISVTDAVWPGVGSEPVGHLVLPTATILWATPLESTVPVAKIPPVAQAHPVEVEMAGVILRGVIDLLPGQRLSEFFELADSFIAVRGARVQPRGPELGDLVVATTAVSALRELDPTRD